MKGRKKTLDSLYFFLEEHGIKIVMFPLLILFLANKFIVVLGYTFGSEALDTFFTSTLRDTLVNKDGTLITIAAVFIGIYFTVFTLLSSLRIDSTFSILTQDNFYRLLRYIKNAFIGSFLYLLYSLFSPIITNHWISTYISITLLFYMLLSALRFGFIIYNIFSNDVRKYYVQLEIEKSKKATRDNLEKRIEIFLKKHEDVAEKEYSEQFSKKHFD